MSNFLLFSLFAPLLSAIIGGVGAFFSRTKFIGIICSCLIILGAISSLFILNEISNSAGVALNLGDFIVVGEFSIAYGFIADSVSGVMMAMIGVVASVVHVYSIGYMQNDEKFNKFFSYLGLFVFSMLVLVLSDNFIGLFIGWEGVGLCSWLLIGFWSKNPKNMWCANEAFIMNRIADLALLIGIISIYFYFGSLNYNDVFGALNLDEISNSIIYIICALLLIGAMGKSAQFPFHTWLADAMAGPTPVSALIHAATMVTAGVYLIVRANALFMATPDVLAFVAGLGAFVAVFGAGAALVHRDLKKIIAYSTLSQLGYMFAAAGLGAFNIALFHLITHAFFKALLFLGAGNIMHAMRENLDITKMGSLAKFMPATAILMGVGSLALCGYYPFAGFFSKDKILEVAFNEGAFWIYGALTFGAVLTAFYSFRLIMLVFFGEAKFDFKAHEVKRFMLVAMGVLGFLSLIAGFFGDSFEEFVTQILPKYELELAHKTEISLIILTMLLVLISSSFAIYLYRANKFGEGYERNLFYKILKNEYFIPVIYERVFIRSYVKIAQICEFIDDRIIDKFVDFIGVFSFKISHILNRAQTGDLSVGLFFMVAGFCVLLILAFVI